MTNMSLADPPADRGPDRRPGSAELAELVHKRDGRHALVTGYRVLGRGGRVDARWPSDDSLHLQGEETHYSMSLVLETFRQAAVLMTHEALGVPVGWQFVMRRLTARVGADQLAVGDGPAAVSVGMALALDKPADGRHRARWEMTLLRGGRLIGVSQGDLSALHPEPYAALRTSAVPARSVLEGTPVAPRLAGRSVADDVVVGERPGEAAYLLRVPLAHPTYFDHPLDHVPGMLVIEAACQSALATSARPSLVTEVDARFSRFIEYAPTAEVEPVAHGVRPGGTCWRVAVRQGGAACAEVAVGLSDR